MNTTELSITSFITLFSLTLTVKWLIKKYPGIICKITGKHKTGATIVFMNATGGHDCFTQCNRCNNITEKKAQDPRGTGGVRVTFYFNSKDVEPFPYIGQVPVVKTKPKTEQLKTMIDTTPDDRLQVHLDTAIYQENYELATYIRNVARKRGVKLDMKKQQ